jgi:16S rRNA (cytosine1402-N4)-methyltransferase
MGSEPPEEIMAAAKTPDFEPRPPNVVHKPVLLRETIDLLAPRPGGVYVDGTLGAGGHAAEILKRSAPDGILIGLDQDPEAVKRCKASLAEYGARAIVMHANYRDLPALLVETGYQTVNGVVLDLGVSWFHLKTPERGFSFMLDGPLDMRMDTSRPQTAADLVNKLSRDGLEDHPRIRGRSAGAGAIARAIEKARSGGPLRHSSARRDCFKRISSLPSRRIHPATLTFRHCGSLSTTARRTPGRVSRIIRCSRPVAESP